MPRQPADVTIGSSAVNPTLRRKLMPLADVDYPFLNIVWTMLILFLWIMWFWLCIKVLVDVFRRHDVGNVKKVLWVVFVFFAPYLGVLVYLLINGHGIAERDMKQMQQQQKEMDAYVRSVAASDGSGAAAEIEKAHGLLEKGAISQAEFDAIKSKALAK